ncbi:MAG: suhB 2 [Phycisphaerales bacterium]|nr:suhB 2 [Phycisphaerales bacterium]
MTRDTSATASSANLAHDLQYAAELARGAGKIVLGHYGKVERLTKTHSMTTDEAVTDADRESQRYIVAGLRRRYPTDGLVGEENDTGSAITFDCPNPDGRVWVIDPIDGTNNFVAGLGAFAVCIGLMDRGLPVLGVVYDVSRDLMYTAAAGHGAWLGTRRLAVRPEPMNDTAMVMLTSNLLDKAGRCPPFPTRWLAQTNWKIRILGSAALEAVQVAAGVAQAAITMNGKLWDVAAPAAIVQEAGGLIVSLAGDPIFPFDLRGYSGAKVPFIATTPAAKNVMVDEVGR